MIIKMKPIVYGIQHVSFLVRDTGRALDFYQGILGIPVNHARPELGYPGAWLEIGGNQQIHLLQLPMPAPWEEQPGHGGRDRHVALLVRDLDTLQSTLEKNSIATTRSRSGRNALFCRDPDGNALEFIQIEEKEGLL
uniref:Catechol 2,3-dioxygenase n=1 Tax=Candidatus Kentrum sp. FW TaxID=2126338 RepID=A0A450TJ27_9GAMM|nr:MAG: Catechol 2,3-dioxygenase [Candidatus Kentron sp. FW]